MTKKVAVLATDYFEESELTSPVETLKEAGIDVDIIAPHEGDIQGLQHVEEGQVVHIDKTLDEISSDHYDALVLPGGAINADNLRINKKALQIIQEMYEDGKPIAAICHAPWILISAGIATGKRLTAYKTIKDDIENAGASFIDQELVIDGNLITSRKPDDLPAFNTAILQALGVR